MGILTASDLHKLTGVSRQGTSKWIKDQADHGRIQILTDQSGRRGVDENDPLVRSYLEAPKAQRRAQVGPRAKISIESRANTSNRSDHGQQNNDDEYESDPFGPSLGANPFESTTPVPFRARGKKGDSEDGDGSYTDYERRKMRAWAEKLELQNQITRQEYLPREPLFRFLGKLFSVHTGQMRPLGSKISSQIAAEFGINDPAKILRAQEIVDDESYAALNHIQRELDAYLKENGGHEIQ